ncbi:MAG: tetratricopeptide repeat protein [Candidatus Rokuibacteriota bacterium]
MIPIAVAVLTAVCFLPTLSGSFLNWDDSVNFVANPHYRGLGWSHLKWMFTATLMGHYIPVTWMSLGLNYVLGGMDPWGYHLGNLLLHATNATLAYWITRRLLAAAWSGGSQDGRETPSICWAGACAALLFGIHPLRVESVAWITERRDVLCGLFFLLAVLAYLKGVERGRGLEPVWRWVSWTASVAALLSKAAAMPLPLVLLLLDIYPLRRSQDGWRRLLVEKLPYAALAVGTALVALIALPHGAAVTSYERYGALARVGMVAYSLVFYPLKFAWPMHLSPMYELPARVELGAWPFLPALLILAAITATLVIGRRRWPWALAAWTYSAVMVLPVSGVVHSGSQIVNDRYSYLSGLGFAALAGAGIAWILRQREQGRVSGRTLSMVAAGVVAIGTTLGLAAWTQVHVWRDSETLWRWAVEMDPACALCHGNLGGAIASGPSGPARVGEAEVHLRRAIELRPDNPVPYFNLGNLLLVRRRYDEAEAAYRRYSELWPASVNGQRRLGLLAMLRGRYTEAIPLLEHARGVPGGPASAPDIPASALLLRGLSLVEDDPGSLTLLGQSLLEEGKPAEAVGVLRRAVVLAPGAPAARASLVQAYREIGRDDLVDKELTALRRLHPAAAERLGVR